MKIKIFLLIPLFGLIACSSKNSSSSLKDKPSSETYETLDASVFDYDSQLKDYLNELDVSLSIKIEGETKEKLFEVLSVNDMYCNYIKAIEEESVLFLDDSSDKSSSLKYKSDDYIKTKVSTITRSVETLSLSGNINNTEILYDESSNPTTTVYSGIYELKAYLEKEYFSESVTYPDDESKNSEKRSLYTVDAYKEALNLTKASNYLSLIETKIAEFETYSEDSTNKVTISGFYLVKDSTFDYVLSTNCKQEYSDKSGTNYEHNYSATISIKDGYIANILTLDSLSSVESEQTIELTKNYTNTSLSYIDK